MAKLYPSVFPREADAHDPELRMYELFGSLPDNYRVFYSKKFKGPQFEREECEVDFIVFDGKRSLLCVEVKGGVLRYDGAEGRWYQNSKPLEFAPDRQAAAAKAAVIEFLGRAAADVNIGWMLCFPDCCLPDDAAAPPGLPLEVVVDQADLVDVAGSIKQVADYYIEMFGRRGALKEDAQAVIERLNTGIGFISRIGIRVAQDARQILEVTEEQYSTLADLELNPRMAVRGFAGTGKTLLAQEYARRLAARGESVLLLFFNRTIARKVKEGFRDDEGIYCTNFHRFARDAINSNDPDWWSAQDSKEPGFWDTLVPLRLFDVPTELLTKYDAIIVDEAQDFKKEWFEFLATLLRDKVEGRFVLFYDEDQDIFGRWDELPWPGIARKGLKLNCRNTKSIVSYLRRHLDNGMKSFERAPVGEKVRTRKVAGPEKELEHVVADIKELLEGGVAPGGIVLLLNKPKRESCLAATREIGGCRLEALDRYYREDSKSIRFTTINTFKGLEADVVFLLDCLEMTPDEFKQAVYVQGSRARALLYVYRQG